MTPQGNENSEDLEQDCAITALHYPLTKLELSTQDKIRK